MRGTAATQLRGDLADLFGPGLSGLDDRALLDRFRGDGDERAFERLVARHGPMVQGVCRRWLGDSHDADDAFQATWLVLVRKAGQLRDADRLGPWLYGVASRVASKARARKVRRRECPTLTEAAALGQDGPTGDLLDVPAILDIELGQISAKLRAVVVLCLLQGVTAEEASVQLRCPVGTVKSRLARGRIALRDRLVRRGLAPSAAAMLAPSSLASPVSITLIRATLRTITAGSAAVAPGVAVLARGVIGPMLLKQTIVAAVVLGGFLLGGVGIGLWPAPSQPSALALPPAATQAPPAPRQLPPDFFRARAQSSMHINTIMIALQNVAAANNEKRFPAAAIRSADGQPLLSWRVAILPYLDEEALYKKFKLDEPWNSDHNAALIGQMPPVFATPDSPTPGGMTRFRGFSGKGSMFDGPQGVSLTEVLDGTSNTVMFVAARQPVVWTQPEGLPFVAGQALPPMDDSDPDEFLVGMADGSTNQFPTKNFSLLQRAITRNGLEVIDWPSELNLGVQSPKRDAIAAARNAASPVSPPPTIEERLSRVEAKLDQLLQKFDASLKVDKP